MNTPVQGDRQAVVFVINSLGPGGAERVMMTVLAHAPRDRWDVHLVVLDSAKEHRTPPDFVTVHRLDCNLRVIASTKQLYKTLKAIRPKVVVSFLVRANVAAIVAGRMLGIPVVISERAQLSTHMTERHGRLKGRLASLPPRFIYPWARHVIAVSEGVRSDLVANFGVRKRKATSIPNPYDMEAIGRDAALEPEMPLPERFFVSVGRLVEAKGFADLIDAYAKVWPAAPLIILGEGPHRADLAARVAERGLTDKVIFGGYLRNPFAVVGRADLFISASHCEGFPNAIAEAMTLGVPVIATDCPSGPAELLHEVESVQPKDVMLARHGVLTPVADPGVLARAMSRMEDGGLRAEYGQKARQRMADFAPDRIMERYWAVIEAAAARQPKLNPDADRAMAERSEPHQSAA